ncbi:TetR/AcrR family transcriptional regulator [Microbulbifer sp. MLAF003]|uniref:TetR/AcrR family transcriptional regulator n=1 Tax=unclassified Microbulbifer TaxID=2619833 RepID=UPI0024ACA243|nr:TetR/AcrR family transcriptional regulator [Microbulbifer sp. MLAF003]WHI51326.1 TetR/AcrR family transcriptional regulator [Microbulbifer sp. MLAF003]
MANTAKFNRREVLQKATRLFWQNGFHATSTRDLQQATNLRPGSIYAAFGSKSGLFKEVLAYYAQNRDELLHRCMTEETSTLGGLRAYFRYILLGDDVDAPNELCLLAKAISELDEGEETLLDEARSLLAAHGEKFRLYVEEAVSAGELPQDTNSELLARQLQVQMIGLRTFLRATSDRAAVEQMIGKLFDPVPAQTSN